jgi:hypothetical protein
MRQQSRGRECYFDECSIPDFAGDAKTGLIGLDQGFCYRQAKPTPG